MLKKLLSLFIVAICIPFCAEARNIGPSYDTRPRDHLDIFAKTLSKKYKIRLLNCGSGPLVDAKKGVWTISFTSGQQLTLNEGRKLATDLSTELVQFIFNDPSFEKYCQIANNGHVEEEFAGFRLAFWDQNTNRPLYPYLAQIRLADGCLHFHYADPATQALQDPIVENFTFVKEGR